MLREAVEAIAVEFKATEGERNELLPSGRQRRLGCGSHTEQGGGFPEGRSDLLR
jgi:hypothetical protein